LLSRLETVGDCYYSCSFLPQLFFCPSGAVHVFNLPIFVAPVPPPLFNFGHSSSLQLSTMEEARMEEEMIAEAPGATTFTLYTPDFLQEEYSLSKQSLEEQKNELLGKDWLTSGLIHKIHSLFPTCSEIKTDDGNKRGPTAFEHKISQLFPPGNIFASFTQLDQAAYMFLVRGPSRSLVTPKASIAHIL
jgi:hypothetical protein